MSLSESVSRSLAISSAPGSRIRLVAEPDIHPGNGQPESGANPGCGTDDDWFFAVAVTVFGIKETGYFLHKATGWPRTSCYAFVARDPGQRRKPSTEFLRILFRSDHGAPFHDAFMHGCDAAWWREREQDRRDAAKARAFVQNFTVADSSRASLPQTSG